MEDIGIDVEVIEDPIVGGYVARIKAQPGIVGQGETPEDAIAEALEALFEVAREFGVIEQVDSAGDDEDGYEQRRYAIHACA